MREALAVVAGLEGEELASTKSVRLLTDSRSGLQLLSRGQDNQTMTLAAEIWSLLNTLADSGMETVLQWVPGWTAMRRRTAWLARLLRATRATRRST